jgi:hypothetical protein
MELPEIPAHTGKGDQRSKKTEETSGKHHAAENEDKKQEDARRQKDAGIVKNVITEQKGKDEDGHEAEKTADTVQNDARQNAARMPLGMPRDVERAHRIPTDCRRKYQVKEQGNQIGQKQPRRENMDAAAAQQKEPSEKNKNVEKKEQQKSAQEPVKIDLQDDGDDFFDGCAEKQKDQQTGGYADP